MGQPQTGAPDLEAARAEFASQTKTQTPWPQSASALGAQWPQPGVGLRLRPRPLRQRASHKCLDIVDEYTRECLTLEAHSRIDAKRVIEILETTMEQYGTPQYLRSDNVLTSESTPPWRKTTRLASRG